MRRREFIASGALAAGALLYPGGLRRALAAPARAGASPYGPLVGPDANGLMLPQGFTSRRIARSLETGARHLLPVPGLPRRPGDLPHRRRRLDPRDQLGVPRARRRRHLGDPLRPRRHGGGRLPDPGRHEHELRRRADAVGHVAVVRGDRQRAGLGVRPGRRAGRGAAPRAGGLQPRGRRRRPGRRARSTSPRTRATAASTASRRAPIRAWPTGCSRLRSWRPDGSVVVAAAARPHHGRVGHAHPRARSPGRRGSGAARASGTRAASSTSPPRATRRCGPTTRARSCIEVLFDRALATDSSLDAVDNVTVTRHRRRVRVRGRRQPGDRPDLLEPGGRPLPALRGRRLRGSRRSAASASTPRARASTSTSQRAYGVAPGQPGPRRRLRGHRSLPRPPWAASPPTSCSGRRPARCGRAGRSTPVPTAPARG